MVLQSPPQGSPKLCLGASTGPVEKKTTRHQKMWPCKLEAELEPETRLRRLPTTQNVLELRHAPACARQLRFLPFLFAAAVRETMLREKHRLLHIHASSASLELHRIPQRQIRHLHQAPRPGSSMMATGVRRPDPSSTCFKCQQRGLAQPDPVPHRVCRQLTVDETRAVFRNR